jgi:hypothetical protein
VDRSFAIARHRSADQRDRQRCGPCTPHSALAINVFDFWIGRDLSRVLAALHVEGGAVSLRFEEKVPTGAAGTPPNLDVVIPLAAGGLVGVESKFTEWMGTKGNMAASLAPYLDVEEEASYWSRAGLHASHGLVSDIGAGRTTFSYLDVPQLLKHALGLKRAAKADWHLRYLYFDTPGELSAAHSAEIVRFEQAVGDELQFCALRYQDVLVALAPPLDEMEAEYFTYLNARYFNGQFGSPAPEPSREQHGAIAQSNNRERVRCLD